MGKEKIFEEIASKRSKIQQFGVKKLGLFGSYARGTQKKTSDADFLVEFSIKSFDNYMDLKFFLEKLLKLKVDLVVSDSIKPQLKSRILKETIYAKGL